MSKNRQNQTLTETFTFATKEYVHNLEVAALTGEGSNNENNTLTGGVASSVGYTQGKPH